MSNLKKIMTIAAMMFATSLSAQQLSVSDKAIKVEELPEYIVISCDNFSSKLGGPIGINVQSRKSDFEKALTDLQDILEENKYLGIRSQTDLLNAMSKLGFDYVNAYPQSAPESVLFSRSSFVFRKKEKYRN
jgi:hypothetical protein